MTTNNIHLFVENYYDFHTSTYYKIITLSNLPNGPLRNYTKMISIKNPSTKITNTSMNTNYCSYVINKNILNNTYNNNNITNFINNKINICTLENLSSIYDFLLNNNYILNNDFNNILTNINLTSNGSGTPIYNIFENKKILFTFYYNINN